MPTAQVDRPPAPPQGGARSRVHYAGLDGLRAFAIASVLVFHLYDGWLPGGFLGVDVFFVISGFLITSLLVGEVVARGRLDLRTFYTRRARRLLPALAAVVVVATLVARPVSPDLVVGIGRQVLGAATFSTNWLEIAAGQSYFDSTAPILFMNLWSLAVEEQFYVLWPVVAFVLWRRLGPRAAVAVPLVLAAASTGLMAALYVPGEDATRVYYGTDTHLAGLMLGAALAFAWAGPARPALESLALRHRGWVGPLALAGLVATMVLLAEDAAATYRGGIAVVAVVTTVLLVAAIARHPAGPTPFQRLLDAPLLAWLGRRSYGLYLWHWPTIVVVGQLAETAPGTPAFVITRIAAVAVTLAVAEVSFRVVEEPIRTRGFRATGRHVGAVLRSLPLPRARGAVVTLALTAVIFCGTVVSAPSMSETAHVLVQNADAAEPSPVGPSQAPASGTPAPTPEATPAPEATPVTTPTPATPTPSASPTQTWAMPTGEEIDGFGDSMLVVAGPAMREVFPGIRIDAKSNRRWTQGHEAIAARGTDVRRAVVLHLGLNWGTSPADVATALDMLGPDRMVVIVNLYGTFSRVEADNAALMAAVAGRPNVAVADWQRVVRENPGSTQSDRLHPSRAGAPLYAREVQRAFARLSEQHTGVPVPLGES